MQSISKPPRRPLNGVLLLDKDSGMSSNTALQRARHCYAAAKAGHTGVLDPLATGLLPVCFGEATKFAQYLLDADKAYTATLRLGVATTTGDAEGEVLAQSDTLVGERAVYDALAAFTGDIAQTPPMYSALKHQGRPLYEYARAGITIERKARAVTIYQIEMVSFVYPQLVLAVRCSKGTYVRTLAEDVAAHMGTVAHLTALRRTATAGFDITQARTLAQLQSMSADERDAFLLPCDALVAHLPSQTLGDAGVLRLQQGLPVHIDENCGTITPLRIYGEDGRFVGLARYLPDSGCVKALRLMNTAA